MRRVLGHPFRLLVVWNIRAPNTALGRARTIQLTKNSLFVCPRPACNARVDYSYGTVCLSVCLYLSLLRNCEETERLTKKVLAIKVIEYQNANSGVPSAVTLDDFKG
jgi:hypothetical protein